MKGSELEAIKSEYKGATRHSLELGMYYFYDDPENPRIWDREYSFKDLVTIDEENFYLNKQEKKRSGITQRKAFYVIISQDDYDEVEQRAYTMRDLEDSEWLVKNTATIEYYTQNDVEPHFDGSKGKGRILAEVTIKAGEEGKLEEVKTKMIEMAKNLLEQKIMLKKKKDQILRLHRKIDIMLQEKDIFKKDWLQ